MNKYFIIIISFLSLVLSGCGGGKNILEPGNLSNFKILYHSDGDVYLMNGDGSNKLNLTSDMNDNLYMDNVPEDVSSKGEKVLFTHYSYDTTNGQTENTIYVMDIDGNNKKSLVNSSLKPAHPKFCPGDLSIIFVATDTLSDVYLMRISDSRIKKITTESDRYLYPQFTPNGLQVIVISGTESNMDLYSIAPNGSDKTKLSHDGCLWSADYSISPSSFKIAYSSAFGRQSNIYVMNTDGTVRMQLTHSVGNQQPEFSHNSSEIVYISWCEQGYNIKLIGRDGTNERTIALAKRPPTNDYWRPTALFSPYGNYIIFSSYDGGNIEIFIVDVNGNNLKNLTNTPGDDSLNAIVKEN